MNPSRENPVSPQGEPKSKRPKMGVIRPNVNPIVSVHAIPSTSAGGTGETSRKTQQTTTTLSTSKASKAKGSKPAGFDSRESNSKDKGFPGLGSHTIRTIWEQYNDTDMELDASVLPYMAEDVTYKLWELINNAKTYSKHSGGFISCNLINEVLKDSDCPPILGIPKCKWETIECDGTVYFPADKIINLRKEYVKSEFLEEPQNVEYVTKWLMYPKYEPFLEEFGESIVNATLRADDVSFKYALDSVASTPQVGPCFEFLVTKCIQYLAFDQTQIIIERFLKLLYAISCNPYSRDVFFRDLLFHLSEVVVSLLMGPLESFIDRKTEKTNDGPDIASYKKMCANIVEDFASKNKNDENTDNNRTEENSNKSERKAQPDDDVIPETIVKDQNPERSSDGETLFKLQKMEDVCVVESVLNTTDFECSPYNTKLFFDGDVNLLIRTIGSMGAHYGYFHNEMTFLIRRNLTKIFANYKDFRQSDYELISRGVQGMIALGEYSFRELIPYFQHLDPNDVPENYWNDFALGAVFLRGRKDIFLYEYLEDMCGNRLQPYMLYSQRYHEKLLNKNFRQKTVKSSIPKIFNIRIFKNREKNKSYMYGDLFPDFKPLKNKKMTFQFAGCRQVPIKPKPNVSALDELVHNRFYGVIVTGRRTLYKPPTIGPPFYGVPNPCFIHL